MRKFLFYLWIVLLGVFLVGCGSSVGSSGGDGDSKIDHDPPGMEGYVISVKGDRILVVEAKSQDFSSTGGEEEFYSAIWFSKAPDNMKVGQKVQVWFDIVAESYPGQSEAKKVVVLPSERPEGADLNEAEAIRKAFEAHASDFMGVTVIKKVTYQADTDIWEVVLKQEAEEFKFDVKDE
ncbi:YobA family protein [Cytobacillus suaedae]|nr:YobA family protein [Cytobacillus suaedae]